MSSFQYPIFLSLVGHKCLVAGLGAVGARKMATMLACGANDILALDTRPWENLDEEVKTRIAGEGIRFENRAFSPADAHGLFLAIAATSDADENARIAKICKENNVLCNCATNPENGSFILPALVTCGDMRAALSTCGASPLLAGQMRRELQEWLEPKKRQAWLLGALRPLILTHAGSNPRDLFLEIAHSDIQIWLDNGETGRCRLWLQTRIPGLDTDCLEKIFSEYANVFPG